MEEYTEAANTSSANALYAITKDFSVGDFVSIGPSLAEIVDIAEGDFGYKSYKLSFLENAPKYPGDWYMAPFVFPFIKKMDLDRLIASPNNEQLNNHFASIAGEERNNSIRELTTQLWQTTKQNAGAVETKTSPCVSINEPTRAIP